VTAHINNNMGLIICFRSSFNNFCIFPPSNVLQLGIIKAMHFKAAFQSSKHVAALRAKQVHIDLYVPVISALCQLIRLCKIHNASNLIADCLRQN
jgi:hypothetical protein